MKRISRTSVFAGLQVLWIAFAICAYIDHAWPNFRAVEPPKEKWVSAVPLPNEHRANAPKKPPKPVGGIIDYLQLDGNFVEGPKVISDRYHSGLEVRGWMVLDRYRRPLFHADELWATIFNGEHRYDFRGVSIERPDIAQLFHLPTSHLGFHFRLNLEALAPGEYQLCIQRRSGSITPPLLIVRG